MDLESSALGHVGSIIACLLFSHAAQLSIVHSNRIPAGFSSIPAGFSSISPASQQASPAGFSSRLLQHPSRLLQHPVCSKGINWSCPQAYNHSLPPPELQCRLVNITLQIHHKACCDGSRITTMLPCLSVTTRRVHRVGWAVGTACALGHPNNKPPLRGYLKFGGLKM